MMRVRYQRSPDVWSALPEAAWNPKVGFVRGQKAWGKIGLLGQFVQDLLEISGFRTAPRRHARQILTIGCCPGLILGGGPQSRAEDKEHWHGGLLSDYMCT